MSSSRRQRNKDIKQRPLRGNKTTLQQGAPRVFQERKKFSQAFSFLFCFFDCKSFLELSAMPGKLIFFTECAHDKNLKNYVGAAGSGACCMKAGKDIKQQQESAEMKSDRDDK